MHLTFLGAAGEVTGSCLLVEADDVRFVVDCGLFQGSADATGAAERDDDGGPDARNRRAWARPLGAVDFVLLTHAHIDHSGLLPRFAARGAGAPPVYCTRPTADLLPVMLADSAHVQARNQDAAGGRHAARDGRARPDEPPLYDAADVRALVRQVVGLPYRVPFEPQPGVQVRFLNAGHILGAASLDIRLRSGGRARRLVVSGDLGEASPLILQDRDTVDGADVLVMESTYGDRNHRPLAETEAELVEALRETLHERHGNVVIPAFALGRTQELLVLLWKLCRDGRARIPMVFVDSPLANLASEVTFSHLDALDEDARAFHEAARRGQLPFQLRFTESPDDSRFVNAIRTGAVILAASGMCDAGRIRHHLRHNLPRRECAVLFCGYQAAGTLGRRLVDGARSVRLFGEQVPVAARIHTVGGLSAHAGQDGLMGWLGGFRTPPGRVLLVHGEHKATAALAARIARDLGWPAEAAVPEVPYAA